MSRPDAAVRKLKGRVEDLQLVGKGADGRLVHKTIGTVLNDRADAYVQDCKMK